MASALWLAMANHDKPRSGDLWLWPNIADLGWPWPAFGWHLPTMTGHGLATSGRGVSTFGPGQPTTGEPQVIHR